MISDKTLKYTRQTINHPYVGIKILPLVGDFCSHAVNVTKSLHNEGQITKDQYNDMIQMILEIEKHQSEIALKSLLQIFKYHARWL